MVMRIQLQLCLCVRKCEAWEWKMEDREVPNSFRL